MTITDLDLLLRLGACRILPRLPTPALEKKPPNRAWPRQFRKIVLAWQIFPRPHPAEGLATGQHHAPRANRHPPPSARPLRPRRPGANPLLSAGAVQA